MGADRRAFGLGEKQTRIEAEQDFAEEDSEEEGAADDRDRAEVSAVVNTVALELCYAAADDEHSCSLEKLFTVSCECETSGSCSSLMG